MPSTLAHAAGEKRDGAFAAVVDQATGQCGSQLSLMTESKQAHLLQSQKPPSHLPPALSEG